MQLSNNVTRDGLAEEMDRICGSNETSYSLRNKTARVNSALDRYLTLAFRADRNWNFDDINETSPPIDTQAIVSGTNRYKFSAFTETLLSLIRLEILNSAGKGLSLIPETMEDLNQISIGNETGRISGIGTDTFQERYVNASSGIPTHYIKYGGFIYLRPNPNYSLAAALLAYFNRPASKFEFKSFTVTQASPGVFTSVAHGLSANDTVIFNTDGALLTGLAVGTTYYVIATALTADVFEVSTTLAGSAVNTTGTQSGNHAFIKTNKSPGVPVIHHPYLARHASLPYLIEKELPSAGSIATLLQQDERAIEEYFSQRDKDVKKRMIPIWEDNR